jgi:hypothetical protein
MKIGIVLALMASAIQNLGNNNLATDETRRNTKEVKS